MADRNEIGKSEYPRVTSGVVVGSLITYIGSLFLLMSFCSPYWLESYPETQSQFLNMGLWEYCFKQFQYPYYQFPTTFTGCHNIFSNEYYVIREWLVPGWLMLVQTFVCIAFILTFFGLIILALNVIRIPLKLTLEYEWIILCVADFCIGTSAFLLLLAVSTFGANAYRRDWLLYPKFNVLSWGYSLCVVAMIILIISLLVIHKEALIAYKNRNETRNLVGQMELEEKSYELSRTKNNQAIGLKSGHL